MIVKKFLVLVFSLLLLATSLFAQESTPQPPAKKYARPDIPGTFVVELGLNRPFMTTEKFDLGLWGSRTVNIYYQYDMRILKSKFSFHPGIGFSLERYKFKNNYTIVTGNTLEMQDLNLGIRKSKLITNYVDVPLELRFSNNPEDPTRSFKFSVGGRVGMLMDSFTKIKYRNSDGDKVKEKNMQQFNLTQLRYGLFAKVGAGNFSIFAYYNLTPIFKSGFGPVYSNSNPKDMQNFTVGISLSSF